MKKIMLIAMVVLMLAVASPAYAYTSRPLPITGGLISLFVSPQTFQANTPFFIAGGWGGLDFSQTQAIGEYDFKLSIDGVPAGNGLRYISPNIDGTTGVAVRFYDFPQGLPAGTYTFTGYYYEPCQESSNPSGCVVNQQVLEMTASSVVTFTP